MSSKWLIVFKKKFLETVKSKAFVIATLAVPIIIVLILGVVIYLQIKTMERSRDYYYIDKSGEVIQKIEKRIPSSINLKKWEKSKKEAIKQIKNKKIETLIYIDKDIFDSYEFEYLGRSVSDQHRISILKNAITEVIHSKKMKLKGIKREEIEFLLKKASVNSFKVTQKEGTKRESAKANYWISYALLYVLIIVILMNAPKLVQSTIEDKNNRVVEIVVSHVKSIDLMVGKILGTAAAGLFQILIWVGLSLGMLFGVKSYFGADIPVSLISKLTSSISLTLLIFFILYFILNFLVYAIGFAGVGAIFSNEKDANQFVQPLIFLAIAPFFFFPLVSQDPNSIVSVILSEIPYLSPLMFMRMAITDVSIFQQTLSILLLIVTVLVELWIASKIFRIGILSYGKKPSIKEIFGWLKR